MQMKVFVKKPKKTKIFTEIRTLTLDEMTKLRGTQREHSSKPLKHSTVKRILVFKRQI